MKNIRTYGDKLFSVAVVHGGPGAPGSVAAIARELSGQYGVMEPIQTQTTLDGQVSELHNILGQYGNIPVTLIGHSWGAWLVYIFAARYPDMVKKIILVGSGPFQEQYVKQLGENRINRLNADERREFETLLKQLNNSAVDDKDEIMSRLGNLVSKSDMYEEIIVETDKGDSIRADGTMFQNVWSEAVVLRRSGELLEIGKTIHCPIVAIHGDYDPHPAEGVKVPLESVAKNFCFYLLERCGHSPWKEKYAKDSFYEILRKEL